MQICKMRKTKRKTIPVKLLEFKRSRVREVRCLMIDGITPEKWNVYPFKYLQQIKDFLISFFLDDY